MLKPAVPSAVATSSRRVRADAGEVAPARRGSGRRRATTRAAPELRGSCFQSAAQFSDHRRQRRALHDLDQPDLAEVAQQQAEHDRADRHADEQHRAEQRDDARAGALGREVGREREADRLDRVQPGADEQEREPRRRLPDPHRPVVSPDRRISANGMIAKPPNCSSVPNQM